MDENNDIEGKILYIKTMQAPAIRGLVDQLQCILTDVPATFFPYHNNDVDEPTKEEEKSDSESYQYSDNDNENNKNNMKIGGMRIMAVNRSDTCLIHVKLDADKFDYYYCKHKITLGIPLSNLHKFLKQMNNYDIIILSVDEEEMSKLIIELENTQKATKIRYELNLMDIDDENITVEPASFPYCVNLPSQDFYKYCKDMACLTDKIEIIVTPTHINLKGIGEQGKVSVKIGETTSGMNITANNNTNEIVQGIFLLKNLLTFTKCTTLCQVVTLYLKNDYPLVLKYSIAALGEMKLCLSPYKNEDTYESLTQEVNWEE